MSLLDRNPFKDHFPAAVMTDDGDGVFIERQTAQLNRVVLSIEHQDGWVEHAIEYRRPDGKAIHRSAHMEKLTPLFV